MVMIELFMLWDWLDIVRMVVISFMMMSLMKIFMILMVRFFMMWKLMFIIFYIVVMTNTMLRGIIWAVMVANST